MKISAGTIGRTVCLALALINQFLILFGKGTIPFAEDDIYQFVSMLFTAVTTVVAWWKNNSFTKEAIEADMMLKEERIMKEKLKNAKED